MRSDFTNYQYDLNYCQLQQSRIIRILKTISFRFTNTPSFWFNGVTSQEIERSCIWVLRVIIFPLFMIMIFDFQSVSKAPTNYWAKCVKVINKNILLLLLLPKFFKLFDFPLFRFWAYLMKVIPKKGRMHWYYSWWQP